MLKLFGKLKKKKKEEEEVVEEEIEEVEAEDDRVEAGEGEKEVEEEDTLTKVMERLNDIDNRLPRIDISISNLKREIDTLKEELQKTEDSLKDMMALYEIVSSQINPFVGTSKVTSLSVERLDEMQRKIENIEGKLEDLTLDIKLMLRRNLNVKHVVNSVLYDFEEVKV